MRRQQQVPEQIPDRYLRKGSQVQVHGEGLAGQLAAELEEQGSLAYARRAEQQNEALPLT